MAMPSVYKIVKWRKAVIIQINDDTQCLMAESEAGKETTNVFEKTITR